MESVYFVLLAMALACVAGYNVETSNFSPLYLRNGGMSAVTDGSEPAYAGYSFDIQLDNNETKIFFGQPRTGEANETVSHGGLYYCNVTDFMTTATTTGYLTTEITPTTEVTTGGLTSEAVFPTTPSQGSSQPTTNTGTVAGSGWEATTTNMVTTAGLETTTTIFISPSCERIQVSQEQGTNHYTGSDAFGLSIEKQASDDEYTVCSSLRQRKCPNKDQRVPGACYVGDPADDNWQLKTWNETGCFDQKIEIIFMVDGSASVTGTNFGKVKDWLKNVIKTFHDTYGDNARMEVLQYSDKDPAFLGVELSKSTIFEIPFTLDEQKGLSLDEMNNKIDSMRYLKSQTYTSYALKRALEVEFPKSEWYPISQKVVIVLTDGKATDGIDLPKRFRESQVMGITSFAVGVGGYNLNELRMIANGNTSAERVYTVDNFEGLASIVSGLTNEISQSFIEGPSTGNSSAQDDIANAQFGSSTSSGMNGALYVGAVGAYGWRGAVVKYDSRDDKDPDFPTLADVQSVLLNRSNESYLGYSLATGFFENTTTELVAAGAPRYILEGAVIIYRPVKDSANFHDAITLMRYGTMSRVGSYFGYSLLSVDIDRDGLDDLLVGAPLFFDMDSEQYDIGRVFVYMSQRNGSSLETWRNNSYSPLELKGSQLQGGRFGSAIANAGDVNADGYVDVIIGAPLADGGKGAVFIYFGSDHGLEKEPAQVILASRLEGVTLVNFGLSLQGDIDLDGNSYSDIAVGAPGSDAIILLRSRPVVHIQATISYTVPSINIHDCVEKGYQNCTAIQVCFFAHGTSIENAIGLQYNLTVDYTKEPDLATDSGNTNARRLEFRTAEASSAITSLTKNVHLKAGKEQCYLEDLHMKRDVMDYDSEILAKVDYDLQAEHINTPMSSVRDREEQKSETTTGIFEKGCGQNTTDDKCEYDLHVGVEISIPLSNLGNKSNDVSENGTIFIVSASASLIPVRVNLTNNGENAYGTYVRVSYSSELSLSAIGRSLSNPPSSSCVVEERSETDFAAGLKTQIYRYNAEPNVMSTNHWCYFEFDIKTTNLKNSATTPSFTVNVTASAGSLSKSSVERNPHDNSESITRDIKYRSDFSLLKRSIDSQVNFNFTTNAENITSISEVGKNTENIRMEFQVKGAGYSRIPLTQMTLTWPWKGVGREAVPLLYLYRLECDVTVDGDRDTLCQCDQSKTNTYNLRVGENSNSTGNSTRVQPGEIIHSEYNCYDGADVFTECESLSCNVSNLAASDAINLVATFRLWTASLTHNESIIPIVSFVSRFDVSTELSPLVINREGKSGTTETLNVITRAKKYSPPVIVEKEDPFWIYIVSGVAGLLLLAVIIVILWKVGFFKRKKVGAESQRDELADEIDFRPNPTEEMSELSTVLEKNDPIDDDP